MYFQLLFDELADVEKFWFVVLSIKGVEKFPGVIGFQKIP